MRLFAAALIDEAAREKAWRALRDLEKTGADYKWVERENLHLTLRFFGEKSESDLPALTAALEKAAAREPFELEFSCVGAFDSLRRPRVLWLGLDKGRGELAEMAAALGEEKPYQAHLTLGRQRSLKGLGALTKLLASYELAPFGCRVERVALIQSHLSPQGPRYAVIVDRRVRPYSD